MRNWKLEKGKQAIFTGRSTTKSTSFWVNVYVYAYSHRYCFSMSYETKKAALMGRKKNVLLEGRYIDTIKITLKP